MVRKKTREPDGASARKPSLFQTIAAALAGLIAVKVITYVVVTLWRLATREDPPDLEEETSFAKKAIWIAVVAAATGTARQLARDWVKPPSSGAP